MVHDRLDRPAALLEHPRRGTLECRRRGVAVFGGVQLAVAKRLRSSTAEIT